ncbi:hypothetical protein [Methanothrix sp.]|uniref:hypothetical protein n=1 Tax=Methanothrix sp. TaxID=90426 RepID=UPI0023577A76|nr:hypothetical protein [Methanothrix sp.]
MNKDMLIRLLALNLGIAAANIAVFSSGLLAVDLFGSALEKAFGSAFLVLSGSGLVYGNYKLLSEPEKAIPIGAKSTKEDYVEALNEHRGLETFERNIDLLLDQIERLQKKNKTIRDILLQILNIRSIINKLNAFDEDDYNFIKKQRNSGAFSEEIMEEKFNVYNEYIRFVKEATEDNEQILLKLDKLLLEISGLNCIESGELEQMAGMI